ncbi:MAG: hypothetical protein E5V25_05685 [Mesorhizobium sp.]|nr:MAG: hypothetical protein E5V25_05685 [Mesorhizobium sp.]TIX95724.1 MAG: hypothetical protein E5V24_04270 [Mesorhizobium sp.]
MQVALVVAKRNVESAAFGDAPHQKVVTGPFGLQSVLTLRGLIRSFDPNFLLCYDEIASRIAILAVPLRRHIVIPVKPGWLNSDSWTNGVEKFVLFTRENLDFYTRSRRYIGVSLFYIPNRVMVPPQDPLARSRLASAIPQVDWSSRIIMCPVRFDPGKAAVIDAALRLHEQLSSQQKHELIVIGSSPHPEYFDRLRAEHRSQKDIHFSSDPELTAKLSSILNAADVIVAAGRTAAEALLLQKTVYVALGNERKPVLVTPSNFHILQHFNFSGRVQPEDLPEGNFSPESSIVKDTSGSLAMLVERELSAEGAPTKYLDMISVPCVRVGILRQIFTYLASAVRLAAVVALSERRRRAK